MNWLKYSLIFFIFLFAGCSVFGPPVPTTSLSMTINGKTAKWSCPKQFDAQNIRFSVSTNGVCTLTVESVVSRNDPMVVDKAYAGQILLVKQWGETTKDLIETGAKFALLAMTNTVSTNHPPPPK